MKGRYRILLRKACWISSFKRREKNYEYTQNMFGKTGYIENIGKINPRYRWEKLVEYPKS